MLKNAPSSLPQKAAFLGAFARTAAIFAQKISETMRKNILLALLCAATSAAFLACKNDAPTAAPTNDAPTISLEKSWAMDMASAKNLPPKGSGSPLQLRIAEGIYGENARAGYALHLFAGGLATEVRGQKYQEGTWASADGNKTLTLTFPGSKPDEAVVKHLGADSLSLGVGAGKSAGDLAFKSDGARYDAPEQNAFHPSNNRWRLKPSAPETDEQLRARLKNHLHHMGLILEAGLRHQLKTVSFRASPSCLHQYNSAVGMEKEANLTAEWFACFYDKNDAKKAYKMLEEEMRTNGKPATDAKKSWVENNLVIFQHLESGF